MIDKKWDFKQAVENIKTIRDTYKGLLSSFSIYETRQKKSLIQEVRKEIYELEILEWQKDKLWEFLNDDETILTLQSIVNRQK